MVQSNEPITQQIDKSSWESCVLCGKKIHPYQVSSALPLADGPCCVSCHYGTVFPTRMNGGRPSQWSSKINENGRRVSCFKPMSDMEVNALKRRSKVYE